MITQDGQLQEKMDSIRSKFKLVVSMLKIRDPYDEANHQESLVGNKGDGEGKGFLGGGHSSSILDF